MTTGILYCTINIYCSTINFSMMWYSMRLNVKGKAWARFGTQQGRTPVWCSPWVTCRRHDMERLSALLALCGENLPVLGGFTFQRASNVGIVFVGSLNRLWSFGVFFVVDLNKLLNKYCQWFEMKQWAFDTFVKCGELIKANRLTVLWIIRSGQGGNHYVKLNISYASLFISIIHPWCHPWLPLLTQYWYIHYWNSLTELLHWVHWPFHV